MPVRPLPCLLLAQLLLLPVRIEAAPQAAAQDDQILERGDKLLEEAKTFYEDARTKSSIAAFVDAGFKLEEARIKFIVLQEIGSPEKQKIAGDRIRAINQLSKLIHDGKVAVSGNPAESLSATPPDPGTPAAKDAGSKQDPVPVLPAIDVMKRWPVPDPAKQRDAEKTIKDLFKEQYAKKTPADRQALIKALFDQAGKTTEDPNALWVLYREAQDAAIQISDARSLTAAIDASARVFDVDSLSMKSAAYLAAGKNAKAAAEFAGLTDALIKLVDELIAADQYDSADKAMTAALQNAKRTNDAALVATATIRSKELAEAKSKYLAMKSALVTLARNPEDPGANSQMGQFLCFVKGSWDLGLRFIAKGSDATLKPIAEKELALSLQLADQIALADSWSDIATREKSPLGKSQLLAHAKAIYQRALPDSTGLERAKIEKRLEQLETAESTGGAKPQDLMPLINTAKDSVNGTWSLNGGTLSVQAGQYARLEIPYEPPAEYDFSIEFLRKAGNDDVIQHLSRSQKGFAFHMQYIGSNYGFISETHHDEAAIVIKRGALENNKKHTSVVKVRRDSVSAYLDGKLVTEWKPTENDLGTYHSWSFRKEAALGVGSFSNVVDFTKIEVTEISGKGKRLR